MCKYCEEPYESIVVVDDPELYGSNVYIFNEKLCVNQDDNCVEINCCPMCGIIFEEAKKYKKALKELNELEEDLAPVEIYEFEKAKKK